MDFANQAVVVARRLVLARSVCYPAGLGLAAVVSAGSVVVATVERYREADFECQAVVVVSRLALALPVFDFLVRLPSGLPQEVCQRPHP